jgi:AAA domain
MPFGRVHNIEVSQFRLDRFTVGEPPARQWLTRGGLPLSVAAVIFGQGAVAKSLSVLDLGLKIATRHTYGPIVDPDSFLGPIPIETGGASIFITLEDDKKELHRRVTSIDPNGLRNTAPFYVFPVLDMPGFEPTLVSQEGRAGKLTRFAMEGLESLIQDVTLDSGLPVRLLALDPAGDLLEGSEDDAAVVKPLMRRLREIAARYGCTVILIGHTAKGQIDGDTVSERGMRGSGAWVANARAAFGLWRPDINGAADAVKRFGLADSGRVVLGRMVKSNAPHVLTGIRTYLQDPESGLLIDVTNGLREKAKEDAEVAAKLLLATIKEAAELGHPFQIEGKSGLHARRADLPAPLSGWGEKRLRALGNSLVDSGAVVKCKLAGRGAQCWLDVPDGGYSTARTTEIATGSLADARRQASAA